MSYQAIKELFIAPVIAIALAGLAVSHSLRIETSHLRTASNRQVSLMEKINILSGKPTSASTVCALPVDRHAADTHVLFWF
jgi:hypothetical protein